MLFYHTQLVLSITRDFDYLRVKTCLDFNSSLFVGHDLLLGFSHFHYIIEKDCFVLFEVQLPFYFFLKINKKNFIFLKS